MPYIQCYSCGLTIKRPSSTIKEKNFCNHKCYSLFKKQKWSGNNNPNWSGGEISKYCKKCGKAFTSKRYGSNRIDRIKYCSIKCAAEDRGLTKRKDKHHNWKGGRDTRTTAPIRRTHHYKEWLKGVFERDNYTCQKCGKNGGDLHAHHLIRLVDLVEDHIAKNKTLNVDDKKFYDISNGSTLCIKCHRKTFRKSGELLER